MSWREAEILLGSQDPGALSERILGFHLPSFTPLDLIHLIELRCIPSAAQFFHVAPHPLLNEFPRRTFVNAAPWKITLPEASVADLQSP